MITASADRAPLSSTWMAYSTRFALSHFKNSLKSPVGSGASKDYPAHDFDGCHTLRHWPRPPPATVVWIVVQRSRDHGRLIHHDRRRLRRRGHEGSIQGRVSLLFACRRELRGRSRRRTACRPIRARPASQSSGSGGRRPSDTTIASRAPVQWSLIKTGGTARLFHGRPWKYARI